MDEFSHTAGGGATGKRAGLPYRVRPALTAARLSPPASRRLSVSRLSWRSGDDEARGSPEVRSCQASDAAGAPAGPGAPFQRSCSQSQLWGRRRIASSMRIV